MVARVKDYSDIIERQLEDAKTTMRLLQGEIDLESSLARAWRAVGRDDRAAGHEDKQADLLELLSSARQTVDTLAKRLAVMRLPL